LKKPTFTMMCGIPGSGKSVKAAQIARDTNAIIVSSDSIREEIFKDVNNQDHNSEVFDIMEKRTIDNLRNGKSAIYDACNISAKRRVAFLNKLKKIDCYKHIVVMATPYELCLRQNWSRQRKVPDDVIQRMYMNWNTPAPWEGWGDIDIVYHNDREAYTSWISTIHFSSYDQNNPHHKYTLGEHMINAWGYLPDDLNDHSSVRFSPLGIATLLHDIGKPFCEFKDEDGVSHYYNHENVGAYDVLTAKFFEGIYSNLVISLLINYHMRPMSWEQSDNKDKIYDKYRRLWGDKFFNDLMMLHEADKNS